MNYIKQNHLSLLIILFMVVSSLFGGSPKFGALDRTTFGNPITFSGAVTHSGSVVNTSTVKIGSSGTAMSRVDTGKCYVLAYAATITASTTAQVDCQGTAAIYNLNNSLATALTGVTQNDNVVASFSTTTSRANISSNGTIRVVSASASTTAGYITLIVANESGTTFTWPLTGSATGTVSYFVTN